MRKTRFSAEDLLSWTQKTLWIPYAGFQIKDIFANFKSQMKAGFAKFHEYIPHIIRMI